VRESLQKRYHLSPQKDAQIASFVGRFAEQKGLSLMSGFVSGTGHSSLEDLLISNPKLQLIFAGPITEGDRDARYIRETLGYLCSRYPGRVAAQFDYVPHSQALEIIFGSTFFFMPSRFEPGGITQLESLACGTLVIGRNVGGIAATIENYEASCRSGNGFLFNDYTPTAFANTAHWAISSAREDHSYRQLVHNAISAQHSWAGRVPLYRSLFKRILFTNPEPTDNLVALQ
jgi:starch synthase